MAFSSWLAVANRTNPIRSPEVQLPAGLRRIDARITSTSTWGAPTRSLDAAIEISYDDRATWQHLSSPRFTTDRTMRDGSPPQMSVDVMANATTWVRAFVTPSATIRYGVQGQIA